MSSKFETYIPLVEFLGNTLGKMYDIELFKIESDNEVTLVAEYNSEKGITDELIKIIKDRESDEDIINSVCAVENEKLHRISVHSIVDDGVLTGVLCVNMRCNALLKMDTVINQILNLKMYDEEKKYPHTLDGISLYISDFGVTKEKPKKAEKQEIICDLYDMGMFDIKGAAARVAEELKMSDKSVYRYVAEIKRNRNY